MEASLGSFVTFVNSADQLQHSNAWCTNKGQISTDLDCQGTLPRIRGSIRTKDANALKGTSGLGLLRFLRQL